LKQGSRVPVLTNTSSNGTKELTYLDLGQENQAVGRLSGRRAATHQGRAIRYCRREAGAGARDPIIRQTTLEGTSTLVQGKTLMLGSLDVPGSTRQQEIEVVAELVRSLGSEE
jgi:hypothetical protein